jgi:hypothetical protein
MKHGLDCFFVLALRITKRHDSWWTSVTKATLRGGRPILKDSLRQRGLLPNKRAVWCDLCQEPFLKDRQATIGQCFGGYEAAELVYAL